MNTYVAIFEHTPDLCPASAKDNLDRVNSSMANLESIAKELHVQLDAIHVLLPGHKGVAVVQAEDYESASRFFQRLGIQDWNDITLYRSYSPQEALGEAAERLSAA
jgi:hypothetical protein